MELASGALEVSNGTVYLGTSTEVDVYDLLGTGPPPAATPVIAPASELAHGLVSYDLPCAVEVEISQHHFPWIHTQGSAPLAFVDDVFIGFESDIHATQFWLEGQNGAVLGLAFKANTDDIRFSPSIDLIQDLAAEGAKVSAYDPEAVEKVGPRLPQIEMPASAYDAAKDAEAVIIATE